MTKKKLYEAMFLVDSADAGSDWDGVIAAITKILERAEVDIVSMRKWDDRRLAYDIKGKSRGTYLLCYFRSDGQLNHEIEKGVQLSERIMRVLILCVDWMTDEEIEQDTPATKADREKQERDAARAAAEEAKASKPKAEEVVEAPAEAEPTAEAAPPEAAAPTEEAEPEKAAEPAVEPEAAEVTEPVAEPETVEATEPETAETQDSDEDQPKVSTEE